MMRLFPFFLLLFAACSLPNSARNHSDFWLRNYHDSLTPGNRPITAGPTWTLEQTRDGHFLLKEYYYDTRAKTREQHFLDVAGRHPDGPVREWTDAGKLFETGQFKDGQRTGIWQTFNWKTGIVQSEGRYAGELRTGAWTYFDAEGKPKYSGQYRNGELDGPVRRLAPDSSVVSLEQWKTGKMVSNNDTADSIAFVEVPPAFLCAPKFLDSENCSEASLLDFLMHIIRYPASTRDRGISGRALVSFVVQGDGSIGEVEVFRGVCSEIRAECLRVVQAMPNWTPGMQDGRAVRVQYTLPIKFQLE